MHQPNLKCHDVVPFSVVIFSLLLLKPDFICNMYIYIQQIGVRIGCYGLGRGTQYE
jgi:hypothetical protein